MSLTDAKLALAETMSKMTSAVERGDSTNAKMFLAAAKRIAAGHGLTARRFRGGWIAMADLGL